MRLECTRKLLDYLGIKPGKKTDDIDPIFTWTAMTGVIPSSYDHLLYFASYASGSASSTR